MLRIAVVWGLCVGLLGGCDSRPAAAGSSVKAHAAAADSGEAPDAGELDAGRSAPAGDAPTAPSADAGRSATPDDAPTEPGPDAGSSEPQDDAGSEPTVAPGPSEQPSLCANGVVPYDVRVSSPAELARLRGCPRVDGSLIIDTYAIESLRDLASLREIGYRLVISNEWSSYEQLPSVLESLEGLEGLRSVDTIELSGLPVSSLRPLAEVSGVNGISISRLNGLEDCTGLEKMSPLFIGLSDNAQLRSVAGLNFEHAVVVRLGGLPKLTDISFVSAAATATLDLSLGQLSGLKDLSSLRGIRELHELSIDNWNEIRDLTGLEDLSVLQGIYLRELPQLRSLAGLKPSAGLNTIWFENLPLFESFADIAANLDQLFRLHLLHLSALQSLAPLHTLSQIRYIQINECDGLRDLSGLERVQASGSFNLGRNAQLQSLHELRAFSTPPLCIAIYANPSLPRSEVDWFANKLGGQISLHLDYTGLYPVCDP
jgi:hypothetical protein